MSKTQAELDFMHNFRHETDGAKWAKSRIEELERQLNQPVVMSEWQTLVQERNQLREQVKMLQSAIKNLRDVKGRHHSEIAYKRLIEALAATEPKE